MTRAELKAALERDRDEKAKKDERTYGVDTNASADSLRFHKYWSFVHGADSRHDDILDLVEALRNISSGSVDVRPPFSYATAIELRNCASVALGKLYAKYGGGK